MIHTLFILRFDRSKKIQDVLSEDEPAGIILINKLGRKGTGEHQGLDTGYAKSLDYVCESLSDEPSGLFVCFRDNSEFVLNSTLRKSGCL